MSLAQITSLLGKDESLLNHVSKTIPKESLHLPGPDFVDRVLRILQNVGVAPNHRQALHAGQDVLLPFAGHEAQSL